MVLWMGSMAILRTQTRMLHPKLLLDWASLSIDEFLISWCCTSGKQRKVRICLLKDSRSWVQGAAVTTSHAVALGIFTAAEAPNLLGQVWACTHAILHLMVQIWLLGLSSSGVLVICQNPLSRGACQQSRSRKGFVAYASLTWLEESAAMKTVARALMYASNHSLKDIRNQYAPNGCIVSWGDETFQLQWGYSCNEMQQLSHSIHQCDEVFGRVWRLQCLFKMLSTCRKMTSSALCDSDFLLPLLRGMLYKSLQLLFLEAEGWSVARLLI